MKGTGFISEALIAKYVCHIYYFFRFKTKKRLTIFLIYINKIISNFSFCLLHPTPISCIKVCGCNIEKWGNDSRSVNTFAKLYMDNLDLQICDYILQFSREKKLSIIYSILLK